MYPTPPLPPPPPRPSYSSQEPYGAVQRRSSETAPAPAAAASYYAEAPPAQQTSYSTQAPYMPATAQQSMYYGAAAPPAPSSPPTTSSSYLYNRVALVFLIVPLVTMLMFPKDANLLLPVLVSTVLLLYSFDLANLRNWSVSTTWVAFVLLSVTNARDLFQNSRSSFLFWMCQVSVETLLFACWACWYTMQFQWLVKDAPVLCRQLEQLLHAILPLAASAVVSNSFTLRLALHLGTDRAATLAPYIFLFLLAAGMRVLGCCTTEKSTSEKPVYVIGSRLAQWHSILLLIVPPLIYIGSFRRRMMSSYASVDEWYELLLVCTVPYLVKYILTLSDKTPYGTTALVNATLRGTVVPICVSTVASLSLQQAYLIPWCQSIAYQFYGHDLPPTWLTSLYLTVATLASLGAFWVSGRKSTQTGEPLFGDYHEDVIQVSLALSGLCIGKAVGLPWNITPLPLLAFLGLSVWISTRMLRYLAIFLFVMHSTGVVLFSYRFAGIAETIALSIPGIKVGLIRFGMIVVLSSVLIGVVTGLSARSPGGLGSSIIKKMDLTGLLLIIYTLLLAVVEFTLLKQPVPLRSLSGVEIAEWDTEEEMLYDSWVALLTSAILVGVAWFLHTCKLISLRSTVVAVSMAIAKALAVFIDMSTDNMDETDGQDAFTKESQSMLLCFLVATFLLVAMLAPRAFLEPVHVKTSRHKRSLGPSGKPVSDTPRYADRVIFVYALVIMPMVLVAAVPIVLAPLSVAMSGRYGGAYVSPPGPAEIVGFAMSLWGLSCLFMINHYLPDGGGETWKKVSALTFLMGVGVALCAPSVPEWVGGKTHVVTKNPYATISSVGRYVSTSDRSKSGGWGLLSASLATLLAVTGPLELQERRGVGSNKDTLLMARMMIFSIMFGCGVAWFITMQSMSGEDFLTVFVTATACMSMSFFGTVAGVLGYFLELENFDEVSQVAKVWGGAFPIFGLIAGTAHLATDTSHLFGMGGWLSTYLVLCGAVTLAFAVVVRSRPTKDSSTRALGNLSCIASWLCFVVVLYGRYGVSGLDGGLDVTSFAGVPISVFGTIITSLILLVLEGEVAGGSRRTKIQFMSGASKQPTSSFGVNLQRLGPSNRFATPIAACILVLLCATIYSLFLRGCGWLVVSGPANLEQSFASVFGKSRTTGGDDLASIVQKSIAHDRVMKKTAKLAGSGFWTADGIFGPLLHLGGLVATLPSLYLFVNHLWGGEKTSVKGAVMATPLNLVPLLLCRGIPTLTALACIGLFGGVIQIVTGKRQTRQSNMQI